VRETQTWLNKIPNNCQCCAQKKHAKRGQPRCCAADACCENYSSQRVILGARNTLRATPNHAKREELISRNVTELVLRVGLGCLWVAAEYGVAHGARSGHVQSCGGPLAAGDGWRERWLSITPANCQDRESSGAWLRKWCRRYS
jgi:hypothetical protein